MASTAHKLEISDLNNRMTMENYIKARACKVETKSYSPILYRFAKRSDSRYQLSPKALIKK
jgi:hypothetical protein